jgi:prepilin-type N-terminal cleavage/methylation domain-containing protein
MITLFSPLSRNGFSLLEVTVVIFVMGLAITALLQLFQWGHIRYDYLATGWSQRMFMSEARVWFRDKVSSNLIDEITIQNFNKAIISPSKMILSDLKISNYASDSVFIAMESFEDLNRNGKMEPKEKNPVRLFCFRKRTNL